MVSVCMATYNGEDYIEEQINSILCQFEENDELIICDDLSDDNTIRIIHSFNDNRIKLYTNKERLGVIRNFEKAISIASHPYIFLADQDDIWAKNKIVVCKKYLETSDLVLSDCSLIDEHNKIIEDSYFKYNNSQYGFVNNLIKNSFIGSCMAFKKNLLSKLLPFPKLIPMHDWWIGLVVSLNYKYEMCEKSLVFHRIHKANTSSTSKKSEFSTVEKINMRARMIYCLLTKK